ncbi:MAG: hypothetical protein JSS96_03525 [Bacteroidetes bacterium]|nr:hypothetical protein [Bacteroidota bacterium]
MAMDEYQMINADDTRDFLKSFTSFISNSIKYILTAAKLHWAVTIIMFVITAGIGGYYLWTSAPYYKATMVCEFTALSKKTYGEMLQQLDNLAKSHSYTTLASTLNIAEADAKTIQSIDGNNITGTPLYDDFTGDRGPMYITVKGTSNKIFADLEQAIPKYLMSSPFRKKRNIIEREQQIQKIQYLNADLASLDSVIVAYTTFIKHTETSVDSATLLTKIPQLFELKSDMEDKIQKAEWRLKELDPTVEILYGFVAPDQPSTNNNSRTWAMLILIAIGGSITVATFYRLFSKL